MAIGDQNDIASRFSQALPIGWFGDSPNTINAIAQGSGAALAPIYSDAQFVKIQTRINTASGIFLDLISYDFFGGQLPRQPSESDTNYRARIQASLFITGPARKDLINTLKQITGNTPSIIELGNPNDCGAWDSGAIGWDKAGSFGDLSNQALLLIYNTSNISNNAILTAINNSRPSGSIIWTYISLIKNNGFEINTIGASGGAAIGAPICDGWRIGGNTGNWQTNQESSTTLPRSGTHDLYLSFREYGVTIAAGGYDEIRDYSDNFDVHSGDTIYVSGWWRSEQNAALPAGVTATSRLAVFFFDSTGAALSTQLLIDDNAPMDGTYRQKTGSVVVPAGAATAVICCGAYLHNTNSTAVTMPSTGLVADIRFDDVYAHTK